MYSYCIYYIFKNHVLPWTVTVRCKMQRSTNTDMFMFNFHFQLVFHILGQILDVTSALLHGNSPTEESADKFVPRIERCSNFNCSGILRGARQLLLSSQSNFTALVTRLSCAGSPLVSVCLSSCGRVRKRSRQRSHHYHHHQELWTCRRRWNNPWNERRHTITKGDGKLLIN